VLLLPIVTGFFGSSSFPSVLVAVVLAAVPVFLTLSYLRAVKAALLFQNLDAGGRISRLFGNRAIPNFILFLISLALVSGLFLNLASLSRGDWLLVFATFPLFFVAVPAAKRIVRGEPAPWLHGPLSLRLAFFAVPLLSLLAYSLLAPVLTPPAVYPDLESAMAARGTPFAGSGSALLSAAGRWSALFGGFRDYLLGPAYSVSFWVWFGATFLSAGSMFASAGALSACTFIPWGELKRVVSRPSAVSRPVTASGVVFQSVLPLAVAVVLFSVGAFRAESYLAGEGGAALERAWLRVNEDAVMIGGQIYSAGIVGEAAERRRSMDALAATARSELIRETDRILACYEANVDRYLDWYYSLPSEYARLVAMASGEAQEFLAYNLERVLSEGVDVSGIDRIAARFREAAARHDMESLLDRYRVDDPLSPRILLTFSGPGFAALAPPPRFMGPVPRRGISAAVGVAGGLAAGIAVKRLADRLASRLVFVLASDAAVQVAAGRAAGAAGGLAAGAGGGALAGAAAGTLALPGPGTVAGGIAGVLGGIAVFFVTDWLLLELEEAVSREEFRLEILSSIAEIRMESRRLILGS
jgi:hypothetical protein